MDHLPLLTVMPDYGVRPRESKRPGIYDLTGTLLKEAWETSRLDFLAWREARERLMMSAPLDA